MVEAEIAQFVADRQESAVWALKLPRRLRATKGRKGGEQGKEIELPAAEQRASLSARVVSLVSKLAPLVAPILACAWIIPSFFTDMTAEIERAMARNN